jgi:hypothetical protein
MHINSYLLNWFYAPYPVMILTAATVTSWEFRTLHASLSLPTFFLYLEPQGTACDYARPGSRGDTAVRLRNSQHELSRTNNIPLSHLQLLPHDFNSKKSGTRLACFTSLCIIHQVGSFLIMTLCKQTEYSWIYYYYYYYYYYFSLSCFLYVCFVLFVVFVFRADSVIGLRLLSSARK